MCRMTWYWFLEASRTNLAIFRRAASRCVEIGCSGRGDSADQVEVEMKEAHHAEN